MKLNYVCLLVSDMAKAVSFWRDVVQLPVTFYDESVGFASFNTGEATLALFSRASLAQTLDKAIPAPASASHPTYVAFEVDDVDASYAALVERGAASLAGPQDRPAMQTRNAYLSDPDGHILEIYGALSKAE
ncbi:VOC family protein [Ktedonosporobacter rubrisoli]|nr:VOC family protein [Ktedonosporobacter rubrisoli]